MYEYCGPSRSFQCFELLTTTRAVNHQLGIPRPRGKWLKNANAIQSGRDGLGVRLGIAYAIASWMPDIVSVTQSEDAWHLWDAVCMHAIESSRDSEFAWEAAALDWKVLFLLTFYACRPVVHCLSVSGWPSATVRSRTHPWIEHTGLLIHSCWRTVVWVCERDLDCFSAGSSYRMAGLVLPKHL